MNLTLIGEGIHARIPLLKKWLDPKWEILALGSVDIPGNTDAVIAMPKARDWKADFSNCKFLQLPGAGLDGLVDNDIPEGMLVSNVYEHEFSIAEYVFSALFRMSHDWMEQAQTQLSKGHWPFFDRIGESTRFSLCGSNFGVLGLGHVGQKCVEIAQKLGMVPHVFTKGSNKEVRKKYMNVERAPLNFIV